ncbi:MAG: Maf family protein [Deinococcales bacterium]
MFDLVLASASPRRRELLERLGIVFRVRAADIDETSQEKNPSRMVQQLALQKAQEVARLEPNAIVLAADTTVAIGEVILNKPASIAENAQFIRQLSGNWHEVYTGIALVGANLSSSAVEVTRVKFRALSDAEILGYASSREGLDKAGGYGIQALGMALVARIEGDYFNVVGLPIACLLETANAAGLKLLPWVKA